MKNLDQYSYSDLVSIIWISLCAFSFSFGFAYHIFSNHFINYAISITFGTFVIYSVTNIKSFKTHKFLLLLNVFAFILGAIFFLKAKLNLQSIIILFFSYLISFIYVTPHTSSKFDIRGIPSLKIIIIAMVWPISCMLVPILNTKLEIPYLEILAIILFYIGIIIPFDIRDIRTDAPELKTFPQIFGIKRSKRLALTLIISSWLLVVMDFHSLNFKIFFTIDTLYVLFLLAFINKIIRNKIYFILLDGSIFLLGLSFLFQK